jgi:hypothetical protein
VNLDLATLPTDVDALHRLVRDLAAQAADERTALTRARAEVDHLRSIVQRLQRAQLAGDRSGWIRINSRSGSKTSMSTLLGRSRRWPRTPMRMLPTLRHGLDHSRRAWLAKT